MFEKLLSILERIATALEGGAIGGTGAPEEAAKRGRGRPAKGEGNAATPANPDALTAMAASAQSAAQAQPQGAEKPVKTDVTMQQVADAVIAAANNPLIGRDKTVGVLKAHGVGKVPELKPEQFASVLAGVLALSQPAPNAAASGLV